MPMRRSSNPLALPLAAELGCEAMRHPHQRQARLRAAAQRRPLPRAVVPTLAAAVLLRPKPAPPSAVAIPLSEAAIPHSMVPLVQPSPQFPCGRLGTALLSSEGGRYTNRKRARPLRGIGGHHMEAETHSLKQTSGNHFAQVVVHCLKGSSATAHMLSPHHPR